MNTLLVDVDSVIPNIALKKISTYEKQSGNTVTLIRLQIPAFPKRQKHAVVDCAGCDRLWVSAIFENTIQNVVFTNMNDLQFTSFGGTGVDIGSKLPDEIYKLPLDFMLYPPTDTRYDFISRGCFRNCSFCIVPDKEGNIHQEIKSVKELLTHPKIKFLDNNFLGLINHKQILQELIDLKVKCQFNQGLDIRLIDDENAELISKLNYIGKRTFAFDRIEDIRLIEEKLSILKKYISNQWRIKFFLYCHPDMDIKTDIYRRILWCKENKVLPYFMRDLSCWGSSEERTYNDFSAWCNQPRIFTSHTYEQFCQKRRPQPNRTDVFPSWL